MWSGRLGVWFHLGDRPGRCRQGRCSRGRRDKTVGPERDGWAHARSVAERFGPVSLGVRRRRRKRSRGWAAMAARSVRSSALVAPAHRPDRGRAPRGVGAAPERRVKVEFIVIRCRNGWARSGSPLPDDTPAGACQPRMSLRDGAGGRSAVDHPQLARGLVEHVGTGGTADHDVLDPGTEAATQVDPGLDAERHPLAQ